MIQLETMRRVESALVAVGYGPGLRVGQIRRMLGPHTRRVAVLEALRELDALGVARWRNGRAWWIGPIPAQARPFGIWAPRLTRHEARPPAERVAIWLGDRHLVTHGRRRAVG